MKIILRIGVSIILIFLCIMAIMKLFILMNKGNVILFVLGMLGVFLVLGIILESRLFTKNPFKTKKKDEKN